MRIIMLEDIPNWFGHTLFANNTYQEGDYGGKMRRDRMEKMIEEGKARLI